MTVYLPPLKDSKRPYHPVEDIYQHGSAGYGLGYFTYRGQSIDKNTTKYVLEYNITAAIVAKCETKEKKKCESIGSTTILYAADTGKNAFEFREIARARVGAVEPVPEPITILGSIAATGFIAAFNCIKNKKKE